MKIQYNFVTILQYFCLFIMQSYVGGSIFQLFFGIEILCIISLTLSAFIIICFNKCKINYWYFGYVFAMLLSMIVTLAYTSNSLSFGTIGNLISRYLLMYACIIICKEQFVKRFLRFSYFLCNVSLILFILEQFIGFSYLYSKGIDIGGNIHSFIVCNLVPIHEGRNIGVFAEPGQFVIFIIVALYCCLFTENYLSQKEQNKYGFIFTITLITTMSTSGFIAFFAFIFAFLLKSKFNIKIKMVILSLISLGIYYILFIIDKSSILYYSILGKVLTENNSINLSGGSGGARTDSILDAINHIQNNPASIFGIGYQNAEAIGLNGCASLLSTLVTFGIVTWILVYGGMILSLWKTKEDRVSFLLAICIILIAGLSQPNILNPFLLVLSFSSLLIRRTSYTVL